MDFEEKQVPCEKKEYDKGHWVWIIALLIAGIILALTRCSGTVGTPEFNQPEIDLHAERVETDADARTYAEISAGTEVTVDISDKTADLYFVNPAVSEQDLVLSLKVGDDIIGESGRLTPGHFLEVMEDLDTEGLSEGTYDGSIVADAFDTETGERRMINLEVNVDVNIVS